MFKLIERRDIILKSLFITGITTKMEVEATGIASIGLDVFRGEHEGKQVILRAVLRVPDDVSAF